MVVQLLKRRLFTVEEYYRMAKAGIISKDERVELIEGGSCGDGCYWEQTCGLR
jgi:hypothetical protein